MTLQPQQIDPDAWYYEERQGISLVAWHRIDGRRVPCQVEIPWAMLRRSLARKDKKRLPRAKVTR